MSLCYVEFTKPIDDYDEASSFSFGMAHSNIGAGTGRQASAHDVNFSMKNDSTSRKATQACMAGTVIGTVWVEFYRNEDSDQPYLIYTLSHVVVAFVATRGTKTNFGLNFKTMTTEYFR